MKFNPFSFLNSSYCDLLRNNYIYLILALIAPATLCMLTNHEKSTLKFYLKYFVFGIYYTFHTIICFIPAILRPKSTKNYWLFGLLMKPLTYLLGFKFEIRNGHNMPKDGVGAILVANHQFMMDFFILFHTWCNLSTPSFPIVRKEFFWFWPYGLVMWLCGVLFIDRRPGSEATKLQLKNLCQTVREKQVKLWFFVEGTRNSNREKLLPFKKGAFKMAIEARVPIVPLVVSPFYFINFKKKYFNSGKVIIKILEPLPTENLTFDDVDDLTQKTYRLMSEEYEQLKNELPKFIGEDEEL